MRFRSIRLIIVLLAITLTACAPSESGTRTETFSQPYPQARPALVALLLDTGRLTVGVGDSGVSGTLSTNIGRWRPTVQPSETGIVVQQGSIGSGRIPGGQNQWDIRLGADAPISLTANTGRAEARMELGGLALAALEVTSEGGSLNLGFRQALAQPARRLILNTGQTDLTATGLLNADFAELSLLSGSGQHLISFDGAGLSRTANGRIELGSGALTLRADPDVRVRITFRSTVGRVQRVDSSAFVSLGGGVYETVTTATDPEAPLLTLEIFSTSADLTLEGV